MHLIFPGNLMTISRGTTNGWFSSNFLPLQRPDTSLPSGPLSLKEATLVMSISYIGAIVGNLVVPHILRKFGCKRVMLACGFPMIVSEEKTESI